MEALIKKAKEDVEMAGISGTNLYVVIQDEVTFVPLSDVRGKTKEGMKEVIAAHVCQVLKSAGWPSLRIRALTC